MANGERSVPMRSYFLLESTHKEALSGTAIVGPEYQPVMM
ncbi:hypothetical protein [Azospirillum largimobile]